MEQHLHQQLLLQQSKEGIKITNNRKLQIVLITMMSSKLARSPPNTMLSMTSSSCFSASSKSEIIMHSPCRESGMYPSGHGIHQPYSEISFSSHGVHAPLSGSLLNPDSHITESQPCSPGGHTEHLLEFAGANSPTLHAIHFCDAAHAYVFSGQARHSVDPGSSAYSPGLQSVHSLCPSPENDPAKQSVQISEPSSEYVPALQREHEEDPGDAYSPEAHLAHEPEAVWAAVPAGHTEQEVEPRSA